MTEATRRPAPAAGGRWRSVAVEVGPPAVAAVVVGVGLALGWRGVDVAAAVHRIELYRAEGASLWDPTWYGGQWTLAYSVIFTPVAATVGLGTVAVVGAVAATVAFRRLLVRATWVEPRAAVAATLVFAVSTVVETSIGQIPYLAGEAAGLAAVALARTRRPWAAVPAAVLASLLSPLAGLFVGVAAAGWALAGLAGGPGRPARLARPVALGLAAAVPVLVVTVLFPQPGTMPFSGIDATWDLVIAVGLAVVTPRRARALRAAVVVYALVVLGCLLVASPIGGNVGRAEDTLALPLAVTIGWSRRRLLLVAAAVPLFLSQWDPAWGAMSSIPANRATTSGYYAALDAWLARVDPGGAAGRVEVVPTLAHWESVWVARVVPLARGWERQSDVALDPIFYRPGGFGPAAYRSWLLADGVRYVALADTALDAAGVEEAKVLDRGVPGLALVYRRGPWRAWLVEGSPGLTGPGASVTPVGADAVAVTVRRAGAALVRVRPAGQWRVTDGAGCVSAGPDGWLTLRVPRPGTVRLQVGAGSGGSCPRS